MQDSTDAFYGLLNLVDSYFLTNIWSDVENKIKVTVVNIAWDKITDRGLALYHM